MISLTDIDVTLLKRTVEFTMINAHSLRHHKLTKEPVVAYMFTVDKAMKINKWTIAEPVPGEYSKLYDTSKEIRQICNHRQILYLAYGWYMVVLC